MNAKSHGVEKTCADGQNFYTFKREEGQWYVCLSADRDQRLHKHELELKEGAYKLLNILANGNKKLRLRLSLTPFEKADWLELVEHCAAPKGGGIYLLQSKNENQNALYWICDLALFVFGDIPDCIYLKVLVNKEGDATKPKTNNLYLPRPDKNSGWLPNARRHP